LFYGGGGVELGYTIIIQNNEENIKEELNIISIIST